MRHSGVCVPRQYAAFIGTRYGHKVTRFFDRLTRRKLATECGCLHNRAALYHVRNHALYRAIGQPDSRYRRPVSAGYVVDRLIRLDAVISDPELHWLGSEDEKVAFFGLQAPSCPSEGLPHIGSPIADAWCVRLFPDDLPIGIMTTGRVVFVVTPTMSDGDFRGVVQRHAALLQALPGWTLRLVFRRDGLARMGHVQMMARKELTEQFRPLVLEEFRWFCQERRITASTRERRATDARFARACRAFGTARYELLYRRWLTDGDRVFSVMSSPAIKSAIERGTGRIEAQILPFSYRHLAPLVAASSSPEGVEGGNRPLRTLNPRCPHRSLTRTTPERLTSAGRAVREASDLQAVRATVDAHEAAAFCAAAVTDRAATVKETWRERPRTAPPRAARWPSSGVAHATVSVSVQSRRGIRVPDPLPVQSGRESGAGLGAESLSVGGQGRVRSAGHTRASRRCAFGSLLTGLY